MIFLSKSLNILLRTQIVFTFILFIGAMSGCRNTTPKEQETSKEIAESSCHDTGDAAKVKCTGTCLSHEEGPNCYVSFRRAGSEDDWEYSGFSTLDRTPGIEYDCYCYK